MSNQGVHRSALARSTSSFDSLDEFLSEVRHPFWPRALIVRSIWFVRTLLVDTFMVHGSYLYYHIAQATADSA